MRIMSFGADAASLAGGSPAAAPRLAGLCVTRFPAITHATKLVAELFRMLTSSEPSGKWLSVVVICASNEKTHASKDATEITVFIPILPTDLPEVHSIPVQVTPELIGR